MKNSVRTGPNRLDIRGIRYGETLSIRSIVIGSALSLNKKGPASVGPNHAFCFPNDTWTLCRARLTLPSSKRNRLCEPVLNEAPKLGGMNVGPKSDVKSPAAMVGSADAGTGLTEGACWYSPRT